MVAGAQGQAIDGVAVDHLLAGICPYRGLLPFHEQDAGLFFGRTRFVDELVAKVHQRTAINTIAVVGRSGSGKSSVVYAGLFPALRREKGLGKQAVWDILSLRPLAEPLHQLARAFAPPPHDADPITARAALNAHADRFRKREVTVAELVSDRLQTDTGSTRLLLYVDQWEELYTQAQPREVKTEQDKRRAADARLFIDLLLDAAATAPCTLVLSVRSDFYPDLQSHDRLRVAVQEGQVSLGPMSEPELRAVIEGPAKAVGLRVHPDLTARLVRDIGLDVTAGRNGQYDIGKLPLLEYALEQAWAKRTGAEIGLGQYAGLEQALEDRANQLYEHLSTAYQAAAKRLFVSLVTPGEGREDTRARITLSADPTTLAVVEAFAGTEARLIVTGDAAGSRSAELSHEALIRHWEKLRAWVDENRANLRTRAALVADRAEWVKQNRHRSLLIESGLRLEAARRLRDQPGDVVIDDIKDYVKASITHDTWRRLRLLLGLVAVIIGMAGLAFVAVRAAQTASKNETRALTALSDSASREEHYLDAVKLALAAWPRSLSITELRPRLQATLEALGKGQRYQRQRISTMRHEGSVLGAAFSGDESRILSWGADNTVRLWEASTGRELLPAMRHEGVRGAAFSGDESRILSWGGDTVRLWDVSTGQELVPTMSHGSGVLGAVFSRDESRILSWGDDTVRLWDVGTGQKLGSPIRHLYAGDSSALASVLESQQGVLGAAFSHDESRILSWGGTIVRLWDVSTGQELVPPMRHGGGVQGAAFSRDESRILSWGDDTVRLWDVSTGQELVPPMRHEGRVQGAAFSRDESRILSWGDDTVRLWEASTGRELLPAMRHEGVRGAAFSGDESRILSWGGTIVQLWEASTGDKLGSAMRHLYSELDSQQSVQGAVFSRDENRILSWGGDTVQRWDAITGDKPGPAMRHEGSLFSRTGAVFSPNENRILSWGGDTVRLWEASTGQELLPTMRHGGGVLGAAFSQNESRILSWGGDTVRLWETSTGRELVGSDSPMRHEGVQGAVFSRDENRILSWGGNTVRLWEASTGRELLPAMRHEGVRGAAFSRDESRILSWGGTIVQLWEASTGHQMEGSPMRHEPSNQPGAVGARGAAFSRDESRILSWGDDHTVRLWEASTGHELLPTMRHGGGVLGAAFSQNESRILSWGADNTVRLWEASTGHELLPPIHHDGSLAPQAVLGAAFSRDESRILSWGKDSTVRLWEASTGQELVPTMRHAMPDKGSIRGAALSPDESRILSWGADNTVRLWDISHLPAGSLLEVACKLLPSRDVSDLSRVYGIRITDSDLICGPDMPPPDWSQMK